MELPISDEPLEVIRANECNDCSLASNRFRRVFKELDDYQHTVTEALATLLEKVSATRKMGSGLHTYDMTMPEVIKEVRATITKLGIEVKQ